MIGHFLLGGGWEEKRGIDTTLPTFMPIVLAKVSLKPFFNQFVPQ